MNDIDPQNEQEIESLKDIPTWTRRYAQSRTVPFLFSMVVFVALFIGIGGSSYLAGLSYRAGNMFGFWAAIAILVPSLLCGVWFSIPSRGGRTIERVGQSYYDEEGTATSAIPKSRFDYLVGGLFISCVLASVILGGNIPDKYLQPVSAIYCVPFMFYLIWRQRRFSGWLPLLWPALYALHAILIVIGAPILFEGKWNTLNMLIPIAGYGILCGLIGHFYNRYALKKLKGLTGAENQA